MKFLSNNVLLTILTFAGMLVCWNYLGFTHHFSGRNSILFIKGYFYITVVVFPIGLAATVLFFDRLDLISTIICSIAFGLVLSAGLWAILILIGIPFNFILYVLFNVILAFLAIYLKRNNLFTYFKLNINSSLIPLIFFLLLLFLGFFLPANLFVNFYVPPDVDAQQQGAIAFFIKHEPAFPVVSPLGNLDKIIISYPPAYSVLTAIFSDLMNSSITDTIMVLMVITVSLFCLLLFATVSFLTNNYFLGLIAGLFSLNRNLFDIFHDSQSTELMGILCATAFILALANCLKTSRLVNAVLPGIFFGFSALIHPKYFLWMGTGIIMFCLLLPLARGVNKKIDYKKIITILSVGGTIFSLWFFHSNKIDIISPDINKLQSQLQYYILNGMLHWQSNLLVYLSFAGCFILSFRRRKIEIFLLTMFVSLLILVQHWSILKLFNPAWFKFNIQEASAMDGFFGTNLRFTSPFTFVELWGLMWYGFNYLLPILAAYAFFPLVEWISTVDVKKTLVTQNNEQILKAKTQSEELQEKIKTGTLLLFCVLMVAVIFYFKESVAFFTIFFILPFAYKLINYFIGNDTGILCRGTTSYVGHSSISTAMNSKKVFFIAFPIIIVAMVFFTRIEQKYFHRNPPYLHKNEYQAMAWIKNNTDFDSTMVYVPTSIGKHRWWGASWTTSVTERRSFNNRILNAKKINPVDIMPVDGNELKIMYFNIDHPVASQFLKKYKITHILIPSWPVIISKGEEKSEIHSLYEQSSLVKQVFKSENKSITATVYEVMQD